MLGQRLPPTGRRRRVRAPATAVEALLRPEALEATPDAAGPGEIIERTFLGSAVRLRVSLDDGHELLVEGAEPRRRSWQLGARVALKVLADRVVVSRAGSPAPAVSPEL